MPLIGLLGREVARLKPCSTRDGEPGLAIRTARFHSRQRATPRCPSGITFNVESSLQDAFKE